MTKHFRRASREDFTLHQPIAWPLYDENGLLLLKKGYVITMPNLVERLIERGCYIGLPNSDATRINITAANEDEAGKTETADKKEPPAPPKPPQTPVFTRAGDLVTSIRRIHKLLCEPASNRINVKDYVLDRAEQLISLVEEDEDAVLASVYLSTVIQDYRPSHQLMGAAVAAILAPQCDIDDQHRRALICAALTRDVGLAEFDKVAGAVGNGLTDTVRAKVQQHSQISVKILTHHNVTDPLWLRYVLEHHERPDGNGYPDKKRSGEALPGSFLLNLADSYASMVLPNNRSPGKFHANAMKELFLEKGTRYEERHVAALIKTLSRFPAGSLVSVANGEICLVKKTQATTSTPLVFSIYDRTGMPRSSPVIRDTSQPEFNITGCVTPAKCQSASLVIRRLWSSTE